MVLWVDGEQIVEVEPHIGYLHRGSEKLCENELYPQIITLFDRMDYISNFSNELAFCMATEKLMGVEVPERAEYIRVILCELNRISSHLLFYGALGLDVGAMTPIMYGFPGPRARPAPVRVGERGTDDAQLLPHRRAEDGPAGGLPRPTWRACCRCWHRASPSATGCLRTTRCTWPERGTWGTISQREALSLGVSGPPLRATGIAYDVRAVEPYSVYDRFEYDIPVGAAGDSWDRYAIRVEEMRQSLRIIDQAIGATAGRPGDGVGAASAAAPAQGRVVRAGWRARVSDFGVYLVSDGDTKPYRVKVRTPSFVNLMALRRLLRGTYIADAVVVLGSLDIVLGEVDR